MKFRNGKKFLSALVIAGMLFNTVGTVQATEVAEVPAQEAEFTFEKLDEVLWNVEEEQALYSEAEETTEVTYADDEQVRVIIVFEDDAAIDAGFAVETIAEDVDAIAYTEELIEAQAEVIEKIENEVLDGESLDTRYSFTMLANAVSAEVEYGALSDIENVEGVAGVYVLPVYEPMSTAEPNTITAGGMVGSYNTWSNGYTGAGMRIAIIDTGLDTDHPSFDSEAFLASLAETAEKAGKSIEDYNLLDTEEIDSVLESLNATSRYGRLTAEAAYLNEKVPFAYNYVDDDLDVTHDNDSQGDHGTHVAGISTANLYVPTGDTFARQETGVVGVAPDAQLFVMKVFGKGGGAYPDDYMAAIEDALVLGADSINLSLGSASSGESAAAENYINEIFNKLQGTDTLVNISAGNSYNWGKFTQYGANLTTDVSADTVGSPGSYTNAFTVASAINAGYTSYAAKFNGTKSVFYNEGSSGNNRPITTLDTTGKGTDYDFVLINGTGTPEDYEGLDVAGKIAIVSRGEISFAEKHTNAAAQGAIALIVYNNTEGKIGMNLSGSTATIPAVSITLSEAVEILLGSTEEENGTFTGTVTIYSYVTTDYNAEDGYLMSDFSSWGVPGSLELKPEITAPGGNIYSTLTDGEYGLMSGTSMAAPSVTGLSALVLQYIAENDLAAKTGLSARTLAQSLLMSTAIPLVETDGEEYSPRKQGAGLANVEMATTSQSYILVGDAEGNDGKVKVELGDDPARTGEYSFNFDVVNFSDSAAFYTTDTVVMTESVVEDYFIANSSYILNPEVQVNVTGADETVIFDVNLDGVVDEADVLELLTVANGAEASDYVAANSVSYDINENGIIDTYDVREILLALNGENNSVDLSATGIAVTDKANVSVSIKLSEADKAYIEENFENGMYVEGYVYLNGNVTLSIPFLAFYGNWTDSSMFDPFDFLEYANDGDYYPTYTGVEMTNYITYKFAGSSTEKYYTSNMYAPGEQYIADRNAISSTSGDSIGSFVYSLIRNAAGVMVYVMNDETGDLYFYSNRGAATGTFYSASSESWQYTQSSASLNWKVTDADGVALAEDTKVSINVMALPAYYLDDSKVPGAGTVLSIPMTVDNTAPVAAYEEAEDGIMTVSVQDNRYVAAVKVFAADKRTVIGTVGVEQTEANSVSSVSFEYPESVFFITVVDYAGNATSYRVNKSGVPDTDVVESITISQTEATMLKGSNLQLYTELGPVTLMESAMGVIWSTDDETVATVDANGIVTAVGVGTAVVTATTAAVNADGEQLSASCAIEVLSIDATLNTTYWDEEGSVYFGEFNVGDLTSLHPVSEEMAVPFWSATTIGNYIVASTYSSTQSASDYYVLDPASGFAGAKLFSSYWNTDLEYGPGAKKLFGTYGYYLVLSDPKTGFDGVYNLSRYVGTDDLVGIAYAGTQYVSTYETYCDWFYLMTNTGKLHLVGVLYGLGYYHYDIADTGISTQGQWYYQSMFYDFDSDYIFYSVYDGSNVAKLYAMQESDDGADVYCLGSFAEGVWPISGLCQFSTESADEATSVERNLENSIMNAAEIQSVVEEKEEISLGRK